MPAKKKAPNKKLRELALKAARSRAGLTVLLKDAYRQLDDSRELLAKGTETMRENAAVVVELNEKLAEKIHTVTELAARNVQLAQQFADVEKELENADRAMAGVTGTIDFLWEEIDRYRNRLMDHIRWDAMLPDDLLEAVNKVRLQASEYEHAEDDKP